MRAGPLRHLAELERPSIGQDARGQDVTQWVHVAHIWCSIKQLAGRELEAARQTNAETTWQLITRFIPGLTINPDDRFKVAGMTFDITEIRDVNFEHRMLEVSLKQQDTDHA